MPDLHWLWKVLAACLLSFGLLVLFTLIDERAYDSHLRAFIGRLTDGFTILSIPIILVVMLFSSVFSLIRRHRKWKH